MCKIRQNSGAACIQLKLLLPAGSFATDLPVLLQNKLSQECHSHGLLFNSFLFKTA